jgi:hypothetical protein
LMTNSNLVDWSTGFEDAARIDAGLAKHVGEARAGAHQSAPASTYSRTANAVGIE